MSDAKKSKKPDGEAPVNNTPAPAPDPAAEAEKILAEAREKAAKIVAEAEAKAKEKAEAAAEEQSKDEPAPAVDPMEELVDYTAPLLPNMKKRDILVGVNGETLRIQRGVPVKIKRKFYNALQNAAKQEFAAMEARMEIKKQSEVPLANM